MSRAVVGESKKRAKEDVVARHQTLCQVTLSIVGKKYHKKAGHKFWPAFLHRTIPTSTASAMCARAGVHDGDDALSNICRTYDTDSGTHKVPHGITPAAPPHFSFGQLVIRPGQPVRKKTDNNRGQQAFIHHQHTVNKHAINAPRFDWYSSAISITHPQPACRCCRFRRNQECFRLIKNIMCVYTQLAWFYS